MYLQTQNNVSYPRLSLFALIDACIYCACSVIFCFFKAFRATREAFRSFGLVIFVIFTGPTRGIKNGFLPIAFKRLKLTIQI